MFIALRYYWIAAKGYRLRPWASPYIRWRMETFFGGDMHSLGPRKFFRLLWSERRQLSAFLGWTQERWRAAKSRSDPGRDEPQIWAIIYLTNHA